MHQGYSLLHQKPPPKFEIEAFFRLVMLYTDTQKKKTHIIPRSIWALNTRVPRGRGPPAPLNPGFYAVHRQKKIHLYKINTLGWSLNCKNFGFSKIIDLEEIVYKRSNNVAIERILISSILPNRCCKLSNMADFNCTTISPYGAPAFVIEQPHHESSPRRFVVDYSRTINPFTIKGPFPIDKMNDMVHKIAGNKYKTLIDVKQAFNNFKIKEEDNFKTVAVTSDHHIEFCRVIFGLTNAPAILAQVISIAYSHLIDNGLAKYYDDLVAAHNTFDEHFMSELKILGRILDSKGDRPDSYHIQAEPVFRAGRLNKFADYLSRYSIEDNQGDNINNVNKVCLAVFTLPNILILTSQNTRSILQTSSAKKVSSKIQDKQCKHKEMNRSFYDC
ncbi:hypothetical protein AGLY_014077 [Aphis glycines]|uniref:Reverse transcriptase domain-containing protein n=1 Tax=Aphis glycines TaxID=307491 RepID=A0A6G0T487_APHGL|nr:hypothetical protein AGLY_014077 [Aphis glycines]